MAKLTYVVIALAVGLYALSIYMGGGVCKSEAKLHGKVAIVTGANTGIGKETALDLVKRGCKVILACRSLEKGKKAVNDIISVTKVTDDKVRLMKLDLASLQSVRDFAAQFKKEETRLDILINNAGVIHSKRTETVDKYEAIFAVNHLGHFLLTNLLLDTLKKSAPSRVVTVSSIAYYSVSIRRINWEDIMHMKDYDEYKVYGHSKLANILFSRELAKKLEGTGVTTYVLHPGAIPTEMSRDLWFMNILLKLAQPFLKNRWQGAQTTICCAVDDALVNQTGKYYSDCEETQLMPHAMDDEAAKRLWDLSLQLVGLNSE